MIPVRDWTWMLICARIHKLTVSFFSTPTTVCHIYVLFDKVINFFDTSLEFVSMQKLLGF